MMYDAIVIGSGFGGALAAYPLVHAGWRVLMLERGDWVQRGAQCWAPEGVRDLTPHYDRSTPYSIRGDDRLELPGVHCVGGASVFYGGVSLRFHERDFDAWPVDYQEMQPYYAAAEQLLGVTTGPALSRTACRIADAAERLGLNPYRLPLAVHHGRQTAHRQPCISCNTCDGYACAISAKNDISVAILPGLLAHGLQLRPNTAATRLVQHGSRITAVETVNTRTGARERCYGKVVIAAAGALATPHLLLASGLRHELLGALLRRHCNGIVFGVFPRELDPAREFHKQIGIDDFYQYGTIQQIHAPPVGLVRAMLPAPVAQLGERILGRMTGLIVIAEDEPQRANRVTITNDRDALGLPRARVLHRYSARDRGARNVLMSKATRVLKEAGAIATFSLPIRTFSHGLGSVCMGRHARASVLDPHNRFRGIDNLYITDASAFATAAGVNPSLTIAALAYRAGCLLAGRTPAVGPRTARINLEVIHA